MTSRLSDRGQITIDEAARKQLKLEPGMIAYQRVVNGRLEIIFLPAPHDRSLFGALQHVRVEHPVVTSDEIEAAVQEAIADENARAEHENG